MTSIWVVSRCKVCIEGNDLPVTSLHLQNLRHGNVQLKGAVDKYESVKRRMIGASVDSPYHEISADFN